MINKKDRTKCSVLMPATGIEPVREYKSRRILSPVRLPVPPRRHLQLTLSSGGKWIRTTESDANRFTVCPLWPLGNSPISDMLFLLSRLAQLQIIAQRFLFCKNFFYFFLYLYLYFYKKLLYNLEYITIFELGKEIEE